MKSFRFAKTMSLKEVIFTTPELQNFIDSFGLTQKTSPQDINQDNN